MEFPEPTPHMFYATMIVPDNARPQYLGSFNPILAPAYEALADLIRAARLGKQIERPITPPATYLQFDHLEQAYRFGLHATIYMRP